MLNSTTKIKPADEQPTPEKLERGESQEAFQPVVKLATPEKLERGESQEAFKPVVKQATPEKLERGESQKDFQGGLGADLEKNLDMVVEKGAGKGFAATDAVNQDALAKSSTTFASLMSGAGAGGLFEMITIGIGFLQNLSIAMGIDISWPESFKALFTWLEIFSLDFSMFGGAQLGVWTSIWTGLLVPIWLIWMFDATRRRKFAPFFAEDMRTWVLGKKECSPQRWIPASALFVLVTIILAVLGTAGAWYNSDVLDALFVVLSALLTLTYIYQYYLYKLRQGCDMAKEDFGKKCQQSEMFTFLFLYQISSLDVGDEILCGLPLHLLEARLVVKVLEVF